MNNWIDIAYVCILFMLLACRLFVSYRERRELGKLASNPTNGIVMVHSIREKAAVLLFFIFTVSTTGWLWLR